MSTWEPGGPMGAMREIRRVLIELLRRLRGQPRLIGAGVGAVAAGATAVLARRHQQGAEVVLARPGELAATTAESVHNAAKGSMISTVRQARVVDEAVIESAARDAVADAAAAGADVTAAAIGVVEGSVEVAHLMDGARGAAPRVAASSAVDAAAAHGAAAGARVRDVLAPYLGG
ncbi:MAG: hypothetical protein ACLFRV_13365 [Acidimicrobiales bacterium]